jgi:hypothetical protein
MFDAYGQVATPSRIDAYLEVVGNVPMPALREGVRDAMRESKDFPPGPGTIRRCALASAGMRPGDPMEMPRDAGPRIGAGDPVPALISGIERRVARDYATVFQRASQIRTELKLPDTLDARLWSLGRAEVDTDYHEPPYACQCVDGNGNRKPCGPAFAASLDRTRREAGERLRAAGYLR